MKIYIAGPMSGYKKIEELEKQLNKISEELESLKKEEQEWPQLGDDYFYCNSLGEIYGVAWAGRYSDHRSFELGNYCKTREEAENKVRATRLEAAIARRRKELNGDWVPDWRGEQNNYYIYSRYWEHEGETLRVGSTVNYVFTTAFGYYESRDDAKTIIEEFEEELLWYFTEYLPSIN